MVEGLRLPPQKKFRLALADKMAELNNYKAILQEVKFYTFIMYVCVGEISNALRALSFGTMQHLTQICRSLSLFLTIEIVK